MVFILLFLGYFFYYFFRKLYIFVILVLIWDLKLKKNELGVIISGFLVMYGLGKFSGGFLLDMLSLRMMFMVGMFLIGVINIIIGFIGNVWLLMFFWSINGLV